MEYSSPPLEGVQAFGAASLIAILAAFIASGFIARSGLLPDHPNGRSSHDVVTPRSGGLAIMAAWLAGLFVAAVLFGDIGFADNAVKLAGLGFFAMLVGLADDRFPLTPMWKVAGQLATAAIFVWIFGAVETVPAPFAGDISLGAFGVPLTIFWIVAFMNVFNFMDGANGLATAIGIFALCALSAAAGVSGSEFVMVAALLLAMALIGFFPRNFPHARLFMGDSGSQGAGFLIAALAAMAANGDGGGASALFAPTVMAAFIFDAAFTLVHRIVRRKKITQAHREHLYQILLRLGVSHSGVTTIYLMLTAISTTAAILMLRLAPRDQWLAPAVLIIIFAAAGYAVFRRGQRRGMFGGAADEKAFEESMSNMSTAAHHAAQAAE